MYFYLLKFEMNRNRIIFELFLLNENTEKEKLILILILKIRNFTKEFRQAKFCLP